MPRLFTALELPVMARTHLSLLRGEIGGARWTAAENLHLTLRFFGDVTNAVADEIAGHLDAVVADPLMLEAQPLARDERFELEDRIGEQA